MMKVSVIIPTYNAEPYLAKLLENLKQQTLSFELIIIDSSSTDDTVNLAKAYTNQIVIIPKSEFDHGGTRTKAAQMSEGEIIIFLTQDALPYDTYALEKMVACFENPSIVAAYGRQVSYPTTNLFGKHLRAFNYPPHSHIRTIDDKQIYGFKTAFLSDSFAAYRKSALKNINWFKEGLIIGEDAHAAAQLLIAGGSIGYVADAKVYHSHSYSLLQEFKRYFDTGVFHEQEKWLLDTFGKAEGEGGKYIKSELSYLLEHKALLRIPEFFVRNGLKYLGYKLGQQHTLLPKNIAKNLSLHPSWWDNSNIE